MNKKISIIITVVLTILQVFVLTSNAYAAELEVGDKTLIYATKKIEGITMSYYGQEVIPYYTVYKKDGIENPAYCVDYFHGGVTDTKSYEVEITERYIDENNYDVKKLGVWRAIINGYPFHSYESLNCANVYEAYAATKQAVFCMLYNRDLNLYTYDGEAGTRVYEAMKYIVEKAKSSSQMPKKTCINLAQNDWCIEKEYLSKEFTLDCESIISKFNVQLEGKVPEGTVVTDLNNKKVNNFKNCRKFKIMIPLKNLTSESELKINVIGEVVSYPMYFGQAPSLNMQSYALTAGITETETAGELIQYPENKTKLTIKKSGADGKILPGVKFNILDENKNIVYENIETNEDGIIEISNIIPMKYYLQEIETVEGYKLNEELLELVIELDENKEINMENEKLPEESKKPELPKLPRTGW